MNSPRLASSSARRALVALLTTSVVPFVAGQTIWDGGGADNNWSTAANWNNNIAPTSDNTTQLQLAGNVRTNITVDSPFTLNRLTVNAGAAAFTLSGSELSLFGDGHDTGNAIKNLSSNLLTVNNNLKLTNSSGFVASGGNVVLNGNLNLNGAANVRIITGSGARTFTVNGVISGTSTSFAYNGFGATAGNIYVNGANTYTSTTNIWHSTVIAGTDTAFGSGNINMGPGNNTGTYASTLLTGEAVTIANNIRLTTNTHASGINVQKIGGQHTSGTSVFSGSVTLGADTRAGQALAVTAVAGGRVNFTGNLLRATGATGSTDAVTKVGTGIVALSGSNNTYQGTTTVEAGTLLINGTLASGGGAVTVQSGATLGGAGGTINRDVNLLSGSFLQVGDNDAGVAGGLTIGGNLSLANGSTVSLDLGNGPDASDWLFISGSVTLGESVTFNLSSSTALNEASYTLLTTTGGFSGDLSNISFTGYDFSDAYNLVYDANSIRLVASSIPEPSSMALVMGGGVLVWGLGARRARVSR